MAFDSWQFFDKWLYKIAVVDRCHRFSLKCPQISAKRTSESCQCKTLSRMFYFWKSHRTAWTMESATWCPLFLSMTMWESKTCDKSEENSNDFRVRHFFFCKRDKFTTAIVLPTELFQWARLKIILKTGDDSAIRILQFG